ncbi:MAG TPA: 30S ribosome-binding factor RbfA [Kofleriaceae bacterium]|nr:30S ribosome-binding factor RbfA [Kofleriaceae bacterium]
MARKDRVESALREELAGLIAREVKDPRVAAAGLVGVTRVECTQDLSVARVYVSIYADDAVAKKALAGLTASAGFLRGPVGRRLNLQRPPELRFVRDESAELNLRLSSIVKEDEAKARAAGRGPAAEAAAETGGPAAGAETPETEPDPEPEPTRPETLRDDVDPDLDTGSGPDPAPDVG